MSRFNIRVYGIWIDSNDRVLLSDEDYDGLTFTKFPGGGLEHGEGTIDCLQRECREELNTNVEVLDHFYTTDYYQPSGFDKRDQLISIYYTMRPTGPLGFSTVAAPFEFGDQNGHFRQVFRWAQRTELHPDQFRFPIDKLVVDRLRAFR